MQYGVLNSLLMGRTEASHLIVFKMLSEPSATRTGFAGVIGTSLLDQFGKVVFDVRRGHLFILEMNPVNQMSANRSASPRGRVPVRYSMRKAQIESGLG